MGLFWKKRFILVFISEEIFCIIASLNPLHKINFPVNFSFSFSRLLKKSESDLKALGGLGDKAIEEIKELLDGKGLSLKKEKIK